MAIVEHAFQGQQTGSWCAPASTRVALSAGGVVLSQQQIATELGTTDAGTDSIHDVTRVLNAHLGAGSYADVILPATITQQDVDAFRARMASTVDAHGAGVVNGAGTLLSLTGAAHTYSGGHYVAVTGYNDAGHLWVSDVAAGEYWATASAVAHWAAAGGYRGYAYKLASSTVEEDMAETFVKDGDGNWWFSAGDARRKITQRQKDDIAYWHARAGRTVTTCMDDDGQHPKVFVGGDLDIWGVDVATLTSAAPAAAVDAAAVVKALVANPDFASLLKAQAFAGAQEAETK